MTKTSHLILGITIKTQDKIKVLRKQGKSDIYVIDYKQECKVKERGGVIYLSPEGASLLTNNVKEVFYHHYMYIAPGTYKKKRSEQEE